MHHRINEFNRRFHKKGYWQYYLKKPKPVSEQDVKEFIVTCKLVLATLTDKEIEKIKEKIRAFNTL